MRREYDADDLRRHYKDGWRDACPTCFVTGVVLGAVGILACLWVAGHVGWWKP